MHITYSCIYDAHRSISPDSNFILFLNVDPFFRHDANAWQILFNSGYLWFCIPASQNGTQMP